MRGSAPSNPALDSFFDIFNPWGCGEAKIWKKMNEKALKWRILGTFSEIQYGVSFGTFLEINIICGRISISNYIGLMGLNVDKNLFKPFLERILFSGIIYGW